MSNSVNPSLRIDSFFAHNDKDFSNCFYFRCNPVTAQKHKLNPYETIALTSQGGKTFVGHLEFDNRVKPNCLEVSSYVKNLLALKQKCVVSYTVEAVPASKRCELVPISEQDQDTASCSRDLATELRYYPLVQGLILSYKGRDYRVCLEPDTHLFGFIGPDTLLKFKGPTGGSYYNCIGLEDTIKELKGIIDWPSKYPEYYNKLHLKPPKGIS